MRRQQRYTVSLNLGRELMRSRFHEALLQSACRTSRWLQTATTRRLNHEECVLTLRVICAEPSLISEVRLRATPPECHEAALPLVGISGAAIADAQSVEAAERLACQDLVQPMQGRDFGKSQQRAMQFALFARENVGGIKKCREPTDTFPPKAVGAGTGLMFPSGISLPKEPRANRRTRTCQSNVVCPSLPPGPYRPRPPPDCCHCPSSIPCHRTPLRQRLLHHPI